MRLGGGGFEWVELLVWGGRSLCGGGREKCVWRGVFKSGEERR